MADLKPIGSEKLTGQDKLNRIMEIARFKEALPKTVTIIRLLKKDKVILSKKQFQNLKLSILNL
jgi:hypothetical protein